MKPVSFSCICPVIDREYRDANVEVVVGPLTKGQVDKQKNMFPLTCSFRKVIRTLIFKSLKLFDNSFDFNLFFFIFKPRSI